MAPRTLGELLTSDLFEWANRLALADALAALGRHHEAHLCRSLGTPVRVVGGKVVAGRGLVR